MSLNTMLVRGGLCLHLPEHGRRQCWGRQRCRVRGLRSVTWPTAPLLLLQPHCFQIIEIRLPGCVQSFENYALYYLLRATANITSYDLLKFGLNMRVYP
jgi:hypothetical protein